MRNAEQMCEGGHIATNDHVSGLTTRVQKVNPKMRKLKDV